MESRDNVLNGALVIDKGFSGSVSGNVDFTDVKKKLIQDVNKVVDSNARMRRTCDNCARAKVRCVSTNGRCERCISHDWECIYSMQKKRGRKNLANKSKGTNGLKERPEKLRKSSSHDEIISQAASGTSSQLSSSSPLSPTGGLAFNSLKNKTASKANNPKRSNNVSDQQVQSGIAITKIPYEVSHFLGTESSSTFHRDEHLQSVEARIKNIFFILFSHFNTADAACQCRGRGGAYVGCSVSLNPEKVYKVLSLQQNKANLGQKSPARVDLNYEAAIAVSNSSIASDVSSAPHKANFDRNMQRKDNFQCYISQNRELFVCSPGPRPDLLLHYLQNGFINKSPALPPLGNEGFATSFHRALTPTTPTLKFFTSLSQPSLVVVNDHFVDLFGYTQDELFSFINTRLCGGLLPWAGDILALLINSQDAVLALIHHLAKKFNRFSHNGSCFVREGWIEGSCSAMTKSSQEIPCMFRVISKELVTLSGTVSEISILMQRITHDAQDSLRGIPSSSSSSLTTKDKVDSVQHPDISYKQPQEIPQFYQFPTNSSHQSPIVIHDPYNPFSDPRSATGHGLIDDISSISNQFSEANFPNGWQDNIFNSDFADF